MGPRLAQAARGRGTWVGRAGPTPGERMGPDWRSALAGRVGPTGFPFSAAREAKLLISARILLPGEVFALRRPRPGQSPSPGENTSPLPTALRLSGKQNLVIMGKKTWFSIPEKNRPLKGRINLVLSRELKEPPQGAHFLSRSLDDALKLTEQPELANKVDMVWIVGGSSVYKEAMNYPGHLKLFVTRIMQDFESDTFFPEIDLEKYKLLPEFPGVLSDVQEEKGIKYKFEVYEKND
ncbi:dihydrofolate reductase isoform X2 [Symphalangus syndactylus]|uniref:dihydrofolate reductase isoform X2 n=1 Tax=Symphalangus syndactylus TaxID=9590 RepID=UPI003005F018